MNVYAVTVTVEFMVSASSRKQAAKFAQDSIEERCVTLEDGDIKIEKCQFIGGAPSVVNPHSLDGRSDA